MLVQQRDSEISHSFVGDVGVVEEFDMLEMMVTLRLVPLVSLSIVKVFQTQTLEE